MAATPDGDITRARRSLAAVRVLTQIRREARIILTDDEAAALRGWSGWGPLTPVYAPKNQTWLDIADELRTLLGDDDFEQGKEGTYNAFYTPTWIADAMWRILAGLGVRPRPGTPGSPAVLEPGCGSGVFLGACPGAYDMVGVERDRTSAAIAALLHPGAQVLTGSFERTRLPGGFAGAIGNVPFGNVGVHDPLAPYASRGSLHNYFIWRAVNELAPGGIAVLLTSRYTMDAAGMTAREEIAELAEFVGAIRLPNGALGGGTNVAADIVVLRRRTDKPVDYDNADRWLSSPPLQPGLSVNSYWNQHPDMVLGTMKPGRTERFGLGLDVVGDLAALPVVLAGAVERLVDNAAGRGLTHEPARDVTAIGTIDDPDPTWYDGAFRWVDDTLVQRVDDRFVTVKRPGKELRALIGLRDLATTLVGMEADHDLPDESIEPVRKATRDAYLAYFDAYGAINRCQIEEDRLPAEEDTRTDLQKIADAALATAPDLPDGMVEEREVGFRIITPRLDGFRRDPGFQLVAALEVYDEDTGKAEPAPILSARQNRRIVRPTHTDDPAEALAWSLNQRGGVVDLGYIALALRKPEHLVPELLGDAVYLDPATRAWVIAAEYLSGNVRVKLREAQQASHHSDLFQRNVTALEQVLPRWLEPHEITALPGAVWIGPTDVEDFLSETLGSPADVLRVAEGNMWQIKGGERNAPKARHTWGTADLDGFQLFELALNNKTPVVRVPVEVDDGQGGQKTVMRKDGEKSMLAAEKQHELAAHFADWVWADADRAKRLCELYNETFNATVARTYDGSYITVDGMAPGFTPYPHQLDYVARAVGSRASLCAHPVGAGKTATMAMVAMKLRQLGLARNPMIAMPKHLLEQTARAARQLFPAAKILTVSAESIGRNRRLFAARVATGDWDMVLITHPAFDRLNVSDETETAYLQQEKAALDEAIRAACPDGDLPPGMVKAAAKRSATLDKRIRDLRHREHGYDTGVLFEQLGVTIVLVDEAHYYKNLAVPCRTDGFSVKPSKRATGLDMKLAYLAQRDPNGRYACLFTGTPVSNTMLELYVVLHYTMPDYLDKIGLGSADAWAATFVQFVTSVDVTVDGGSFNLKTRPALFVNAPELRMLLSMCADVRTADMLGLARPGVDERVIVIEPTEAQQQFSEELVDRAEAVKGKGRNTGKGADNMLKICTDGRLMATDPALVGIGDTEPAKLHRVAAEMLAVWQEFPEDLQIGFCDIGTPNAKKGPQTYGRLRQMLIDGGMPASRIVFVHDAKTGPERAALFARCRNGSVSVILGSTDKLGVGTNIQTRVVAMHHIDAPFRPADVEQRDGRGQRPGNRHAVVRVYRYVVARTFDAYMWQMLARKIGFIAQILSGQLDRTVEDVTPDVVLSYAAIKAAATGQPLLIERAEVEMQVKKLRGQERAWKLSRVQMLHQVNEAPMGRGRMADERAKWADIAAAYTGETTEQDVESVAACVAEPWRFRNGLNVAGLHVSIGTAHNGSEDLPTIHIRGPRSYRGVRRTLAKFHKAPQFMRTIFDVGRGAAGEVRRIDAWSARFEAEIAEMEQLLQVPFQHADDLTAALARLDQIEAELRAAADASRPEQEATESDLEAAAAADRARAQADLDGTVEVLLAELQRDLENDIQQLLDMLA